MSTERRSETGGPAFPHTRVKIDGACIADEIKESGMSLRDYFAAKALQGMLSQPADAANVLAYDHPDRAATWAYEFADAMLEARNR